MGPLALRVREDFFVMSTVKGGRNDKSPTTCSGLWVEFKCPLCGKDLDDDKTMANFLVCGDSSHGSLRFFTGDGCYFTTNEKAAEELMKKGKRVHIVDPKEFFGNQTTNLE
jgi:hypothetical protein